MESMGRWVRWLLQAGARLRRVSALNTVPEIKAAIEQLSSFANPPEADKGLLATGELRRTSRQQLETSEE